MITGKNHPRPFEIGSSLFEWGSCTYIAGIVNVTPDSFSGDGISENIEKAVLQALEFQELGAHIIDVGGESTRPKSIYGDSKPVSVDEELSRVLPVIEILAKDLRIPISIDTYKSKVAEACLEAGAHIVNDVWGFRADPMMAKVVSQTEAVAILMHNQDGTFYKNLVPDIITQVRSMIDFAVESGVDFDKLIIDPGIGFGKTSEQNLEVLRNLLEFTTLGRPVMLGMSRKSTIGYVLDLPVEDRLEGTAASVALSIAFGADIVRVHDVKEMVRVSRMSDAIVRGWTH
ncbi:MAG: dihydropteroate synthase [Chloroflexota bacterium]|nr:dihydropteroate synthase [Chloroflexota bacterium]